MDRLVIEGQAPLNGSVRISGSKNAGLPILFATLLTKQHCVLHNVPDLADIGTTEKLLRGLGVSIERDLSASKMSVSGQTLTSVEAPYDLVRTMRASILALGPLVARCGEARVSLPGGCSIGARPVNLHLAALEKMGAEINLENGYIHAKARKLKGTDFTFQLVSVTATENIMMAASLAEGRTTLRNAAAEPEVVDLAHFLRKMGARIEGEGTSTLTIDGVSTLHGAEHTIIPDRIEAGTYLSAAALTGSEITLEAVEPEHLTTVMDHLKAAGTRFRLEPSSIHVMGPEKITAVDVSTAPYPGFPTDMQAQLMTVMTIAHGHSTITENIFENRFMHVPELVRLGANISVQGHSAHVEGLNGRTLTGATVMATDLRASASLVLAGLAARGTTTVRRVYHLDRGYERMEEKLKKLGARIWREQE